MYPVIHSVRVQRGLVQGFRCPVTGKEFIATNPAGAEMEALYREQQRHSADAYHRQDGTMPNPTRSLEDRRAQFRSDHP